MAFPSERLFRIALHYVAFAGAFIASAWLRFGPLGAAFAGRHEPPMALYFQFALLFAGFAVAVLIVQGEYDAPALTFSPSRFVARGAIASLWALALLILFAYFTKPTPPSRVVLALTLLLSVVFIGVVALIERRRTEKTPVTYYVIASGGRGEEMAALLRRARKAAQVVSFPAGEGETEALVAELRERLANGPAPAGILCVLNGPSRLQNAILTVALRFNVPVKFVPSEEGLLLRRLSLEEIEGVPLLSPRPLHTAFANQAIKRALDLVLALALIVVTLPLWLVLILAIPLESPGGPFYLHRRLGRGGKPFYIYKFRTMRRGADRELAENGSIRSEFNERFKLRRDPRVTRLGALLRKLSLDELPQLINVVTGEMSLIGPRPIVPEETPKYGEWADLLFAVKPGLTGLWQVSGRTDLSYEKRVQLDIYYILNWSLWLDFYILLLTPAAVLSGKGAYTL
jgi:exopolysaccharide biosynthesis polyprenyl glycosylphosphotransferase